MTRMAQVQNVRLRKDICWGMHSSPEYLYPTSVIIWLMNSHLKPFLSAC
jgi:hypothetical protein